MNLGKYGKIAALLLAAGALLWCGSLNAGKGGGKGGGETAPGGTIFFSTVPDAFTQEIDLYGINPDGTGEARALPLGTLITSRDGAPEPSEDTYNGERIWLTLAEVYGPNLPREVVAVRRNGDGTVSRLPLTSVAGDIAVASAPNLSVARWGSRQSQSGDPLYDDFVSFAGEVDGVGCIFRVEISAAEVSLAMDGTIPWTPATTSDVEVVVCKPDTGWYYDWSPDGTKVAYASEGLRVYDVSTGTSTLIAGGGRYEFVERLRWSPDGTKIAFYAQLVRQGKKGGSDYEYGIFTANPDGSNRILVAVDDPGRVSFDFPVWSPNSQHLACWQFSTRKGVDVADVVRMKADGSGKTIVAADFYPPFVASLPPWR